VEEDASSVSGVGRVAAKIVVDTTLNGGLKYSSNIGWNSKSKSFFKGGLADVETTWLIHQTGHEWFPLSFEFSCCRFGMDEGSILSKTSGSNSFSITDI
ncbi:hypothetical protein Tco_1117185, partial [Tanacetum coccineum]